MPSSGSDAGDHDVTGSTYAAGSTSTGDGVQSDEPRWGLGVYQRVFLTESAANTWYNWNRLRGDPAQPFHYQHMVLQVQQQVSRAGSSPAQPQLTAYYPRRSGCQPPAWNAASGSCVILLELMLLLNQCLT
jgi:hypothetical protein